MKLSDLPPPPPLTANQLLENTVRVLLQDGMGEHVAYYKAARAIARLISIGALEWWGMSDEGEPLFVQAEPSEQQQILILPIVIREEE